MDRKAWSLALVSLAAYLDQRGPQIKEARLVLGWVSSTPWQAREAEKLLVGQRFSQGLAERAAEAALTDARPLRQNRHKLDLANALIRKALDRLIGGET
jgi:xanthine dehydrogenase YagS FAD-binding subunit